MRNVTTIIPNVEWMAFKAWCSKKAVEYSIEYDCDSGVLVKVSAWDLVRWTEGG